jgi:hypothetical protein
MAPLQTLDRPQRAAARSATFLGRYTDPNGLQRELVSVPGARGSALVIDRLTGGLGDERLVAHLWADEPAQNASIVAALYLADARGRRCRALTDDDLRSAPPGSVVEEQTPTNESHVEPCSALMDSHGFVYELVAQTFGRIKEMRWHRRSPDGSAESSTLREVIGALESYEPARTLTARALRVHRDDPGISVTSLRAELERITSSHIVLNRQLREAVLAAVRRDGTTLSEIAIRCGRIKHDARGKESGETSWLARRIGVLPEGGHEAPTPWVSSDVLALIAREGLGIAPREVEPGS